MQEFDVNINEAEELSTKGQKMNIFRKIYYLILYPGELMKTIEGKPDVLFPAILALVTPIIILLSRFPLLKEAIRQKLISGTISDSPVQITEQMLSLFLLYDIISMLITTFFNLLITGTLIFVIAKILRGHGTFKHYISISAYSSMVNIFQQVLNIIVSFFTGKVILNGASIASFSLLVPEDFGGQFMYSLIGKIDIFSIWQYVIVFLGFQQVSKISKLKSSALIVILYLITILIALKI